MHTKGVSMKISQVSNRLFTSYNQTTTSKELVHNEVQAQNRQYATIPANFRYGAKISFQGEYGPQKQTIPHIDYEEYMAMNKYTKERLRKRYNKFLTTINKEEMFDQKNCYMPLSNEETMNKFIEASKIYAKYKDNPIICLGRSPKWFLNAALWMKDGINDYNFIAFSKYWYRPDPIEGLIKIRSMAPTEKEEMEYRKYLKRKKADPKTIVTHFEETGKKTIITDYICSGKGACSFIDVLSHYAEDLGLLERFSKSIKIVGIGCLDYMEQLNPYEEYISEPRVIMPERLIPYDRNIEQEFHNLDYNMFSDMLLNQNVNECRSTYYPHWTWTVYKPDRFKTGLINDMKKVQEMVKQLKGNTNSMTSFTPAMADFRNLLNFHILDALNSKGLLKIVHKSKI